MKSFLIILLFPIFSYSLTVRVIGPCSITPDYEFEVGVSEATGLGQLTIASFNQFQIPYIGNENGLNSLLGFPTGLEALEVISDTKMRAHGPCFMLDGEILESFPSDVTIYENNKTLTWFIGYSTMVKDQWIGQCELTGEIAPKKYCHIKLK